MEYPGYGLYKGSPNSDRVLRDAVTVYDHLNLSLGVAESDIIVFGRSIGSSPACYLSN